jgi:anaerobic selenocysteine-containing dehydrogenase
MLRHSDGKVHLAIERLLEDLDDVRRGSSDEEDGAFPLVLIAGERRSYNANTIYRNPAWRCTDTEGALRIHPDDARRYGVSDGSRVRCASRRGSVEARVAVSDRCPAGVVTLPHGYGLDYPDAEGVRRVTGPVVNDLTHSDHCDPLTATPYHKHVRVKLEAL